MEEIEKLIEKYNKPLDKESLKKALYNIFCIMILILPILPETIGLGIYSLRNTIFNGITIVATLTLGIIGIREKNKSVTIYEILLSIYFVLIVVSAATSKYGFWNCFLGANGRGEGILTNFSYFMTFVIILKGYKYLNRYSLLVGIIAATVVSGYGIIQANVPLDVKLPFGSSDVLGVAEGTMKNQNFLSSYICLFLPTICFSYITKNIKRKNIDLLYISILFAALVFAKTLGGYLTFVVMYLAVSIFAILYSKNKSNTLRAIAIVTIIIVCIFSLITFTKDKSYANELAQTKTEVTKLVTKDKSFGTSRMEIWKKTLMAINSNKLFGVGPDSLKLEFLLDKYKTNGEQDMLNHYVVDKAHSEPLHIAVTTGIPSMLIYLIFVGYLVIKLGLKVLKDIKANGINENNIFNTMVIISILSYLMQSAINISVVQVAPTFWLVLGLGAGIEKSIENAKNTNKKS